MQYAAAETPQYHESRLDSLSRRVGAVWPQERKESLLDVASQPSARWVEFVIGEVLNPRCRHINCVTEYHHHFSQAISRRILGFYMLVVNWTCLIGYVRRSFRTSAAYFGNPATIRGEPLFSRNPFRRPVCVDSISRRNPWTHRLINGFQRIKLEFTWLRRRKPPRRVFRLHGEP